LQLVFSDMSAGQNQTLFARERRAASRDGSVPLHGLEKSARVDLGLALFREGWAVPHVEYTRQEIAMWAGCTDAAILAIEQAALLKVRRALFLRGIRPAGEFGRRAA